MKKIHFFCLILSLLMFPALNLSAETFMITYDAYFSAPTDCPGPVVNAQDANWVGGAVDVNMKHDIINVTGSPTFPYTVDQTGSREILWDIYDVDAQGNETLEGTITDFASILNGGVISGSSTGSFSFNMNDVVNAGISTGQKVVRLRIRLELTPKAHNINGFVRKNGDLQCSANPLDGYTLTCELGVIDCFNFQACEATLDVLAGTSVEEIIGIGGGVSYVYSYHYSALVSGGSGNFSYAWSGPGIPSSSNTSSYSFKQNGPKGWVYLTVTDNVTGCIYTWFGNMRKKEGTVDPSVEAFDFQIGPNPVSQGQKLVSHFVLNQHDTYSLQVLDLHGKILFQVQDTEVAVAGEHSLEIPNDLATGMYMVKMTSQELGTQIKRLVIQ